MKLFISYSRDDKAWVYELWRALRDRAHHDAWIDQRLIPAQDWWESILHNIEAAECCIYVMTPKSVESIYCATEVDYALTLNKPVIPLMLKSCDIPAEIRTRRIQYSTINDSDSLGDVLFTVERAIGEIRVGLIQGKYVSLQSPPKRPSEPTPERKPEQVSEVFMLAEESAHANNFTLAEKMFQQVIDADPQGYGLAAAERLGEIRYERTRDQDYVNIVQMASNPAMRKGVLALWRVFVGKYGTDYDPSGISGVINQQPVVNPPQQGQTIISNIPADPHGVDATQDDDTADASIAHAPAKPRSVIDILPSPFEWLDIPAGEVKITQSTGKSKNLKVSSFKIGKYPITNAQFQCFIDARGYDIQQYWSGQGWVHRVEDSWTRPDNWRKGVKLKHPVTGISWFEVVAFCNWLSEVSGEEVTIPSEEQWQWAAQGNTKQDFPWGSFFITKYCNYDKDGRASYSWSEKSKTTSVEQFLGDAESPFGVVDMIGNVWEWCSTSLEVPVTRGFYNSVPQNRVEYVVRGGSWKTREENKLTVYYRESKVPLIRDNDLGFRIVCLNRD